MTTFINTALSLSIGLTLVGTALALNVHWIGHVMPVDDLVSGIQMLSQSAHMQSFGFGMFGAGIALMLAAFAAIISQKLEGKQ
jgi:uncharacterized membrane protein YczE